MSFPARLAVGASLLAAGMIGADLFRLLKHLHRTPAAWTAIDMGAMQFGLLGLTLAVAWMLPRPLSDTLGLRRARLPVGALAALVVGALGLSHAIDAALSLTRSAETSVAVGVARVMQRASGPSLGLALLGSVLAPALGEELLCRGLVQRSVARALGPFAAIGIASVVFGVIHMEWTHGLIAAAIGAYLGVAAFWADSTRPAILAHGLNNLASLLGSLGILGISAPALPSLLAGLALAAAGLALARRAWSRRGTMGPDAPLQPKADSADG